MATIRQRNGKWQVQVRKIGHSPVSKTFTKKVLAEQWAREQELKIDEGSYRDLSGASKALLCDLFEKYLQTITPTKEATSYVPEKARLGTLRKHFGTTTLAQLSVHHILAYADERLIKVSSDAIRRELQLLSDVVDSAQSLWGLHIIANPVPNAKRILRKLRKLKPGNRRERRLLVGEYELIANARHSRFTIINKIALFDIETGLRRSELANAKREHVDIAKRVIVVTKSKSDWKTGGNGRVVPLSSIAIGIIKTIPAFIDGSLFGMKAESISQAFERLCEQQGIVDLRFHDLRHEAISRMFEKGLTIEQVASISGHSDWKSLKRYTHPDPEKLALRL